MKIIKALLANTLITIISLSLTLLAAEACMYLVGYMPPEYVTYDKYKDMNYLYRPNSTAVWYGQLGSITDYKSTVRTNSLVYHDIEHDFKKPADIYRIVILGDSYVESFQVELPFTFFRKLEAALNQNTSLTQSGLRFEVITLGNSGNGSIKEMMALKKYGLKYEPDLVLSFMTDQNDFHDDWAYMRILKKEAEYTHPNFKPRNIIKEKLAFYDKMLWIENSRLCKWIAFKLTEGWMKKASQKVVDDQWKEKVGAFVKIDENKEIDEANQKWTNAFGLTMGTYVQMQKLSLQSGAKFGAVLVDSRLNNNPFLKAKVSKSVAMDKYQLDFGLPIKKTKIVFDKYGIPYLDLNPVFKAAMHKKHGKKNTRFAHDGHWNQHGHNIVFEALQGYVIDQFLNSNQLN